MGMIFINDFFFFLAVCFEGRCYLIPIRVSLILGRWFYFVCIWRRRLVFGTFLFNSGTAQSLSFYGFHLELPVSGDSR
jgi:hypothetical protein